MIAKRDESERDGHLGSADLVIIEERSSHSDQPIKRYSKGKLLGKVSISRGCRAALQNATNSRR